MDSPGRPATPPTPPLSCEGKHRTFYHKDKDDTYFSENNKSEWFQCEMQLCPNRYTKPTTNPERADLTKVPTKEDKHKLSLVEELEKQAEADREEQCQEVIKEYKEQKRARAVHQEALAAKRERLARVKAKQEEQDKEVTEELAAVLNKVSIHNSGELPEGKQAVAPKEPTLPFAPPNVPRTPPSFWTPPLNSPTPP